MARNKLFVTVIVIIHIAYITHLTVVLFILAFVTYYFEIVSTNGHGLELCVWHFRAIWQYKLMAFGTKW